MKTKLGDLIVQIISVMIGVFLGFLVSNWSENKKETTRANLLLRNIASEIETNKVEVEQVIAYHKALRDTSRFYLRQPSLKIFKPDFFKGVNTVTFVNSAFETGVQTGLINEIAIDELQILNNVYAKQRNYEEFANILLAGLITQDFHDIEEDERAARRILMYLSISMTDVVIKENQLLNSYKQALAILDN